MVTWSARVQPNSHTPKRFCVSRICFSYHSAESESYEPRPKTQTPMRSCVSHIGEMVNKAIPLAENSNNYNNSRRSLQRISKMLPLRRKICALDNYSQSFVRSCLRRSICMGFASLWLCWQRCACSVSVLIVQRLFNFAKPFRHTTRTTFQLSGCPAWLLYLHTVGKQHDRITEAGHIILQALQGPSEIARCLLLVIAYSCDRFVLLTGLRAEFGEI